MMPELRDGGSPAWAVTFGDLMSMLLTFFVMFTSYATLDARRFEALSQSLQDSLGSGAVAQVLPEGGGPGPAAPRVAAIVPGGTRDEASLARRLRMTIRERRLERMLVVETAPLGVVIRLPGQLLFAEGSEELQSELLPILHEIAGVLAEVPGDISIEGHASDAEGQQARFELSCARSLAVLRHLVEVEGFDRRRLRVTGFGDVRPLVPDSGPQARAWNRRIEFVLLRPAPTREAKNVAELSARSGAEEWTPR